MSRSSILSFISSEVFEQIAIAIERVRHFQCDDPMSITLPRLVSNFRYQRKPCNDGYAIAEKAKRLTTGLGMFFSFSEQFKIVKYMPFMR